jgi:hypothetical protein
MIMCGYYSGSPLRLELEKPTPLFPFNGMGLVPDVVEV